MGAVLRYGRITLKPLADLDQAAWRRLHAHFHDPEIAHLNGTLPSRLPLWLLRLLLKADSRRPDRAIYGIFDEADDYIGTIELYEIRARLATLGIIIGEKSHWGRGYGTEAIAAILQHAFETLCLERVVLSTFGDNLRAQAAFKKVGFKELRRIGNRQGRISVQMELTSAQWGQSHSTVALPPLSVPASHE